ncbi:MAG: hypothetical protein QNJ45_12230 [Ardenticatenaceae bacterium]|nr:hypothetical protein [Ardenticatenaceae bacterium]
MKTPESSSRENPWEGFVQAAGVILAVSYPVLAISTGFRAVYQLYEQEAGNAPWLTLVAATCYTLATIGFAKQPRPNRNSKPPRTFLGRWWRSISPQTGWRISAYVLIFESILTIVIGTLSFTHPDLLGRNVWQFFGRDYGYFPLVQPLLGLAWLYGPQTLRAYGWRPTQVKS